jgi:hypothetical protein
METSDLCLTACVVCGAALSHVDAEFYGITQLLGDARVLNWVAFEIHETGGIPLT